jgi:hypothetical protein
VNTQSLYTDRFNDLLGCAAMKDRITAIPVTLNNFNFGSTMYNCIYNYSSRYIYCYNNSTHV